jgi:hypothetical protein
VIGCEISLYGVPSNILGIKERLNIPDAGDGTQSWKTRISLSRTPGLLISDRSTINRSQNARYTSKASSKQRPETHRRF